MEVVPFGEGMMLAGVLFCLGLIGVMVRRNLLFVLMSLDLMLNAAALAFIVAAARWGEPDGQVVVVFVLAVAAAESVLALALILQLHRVLHTLDSDFASRLRG